MAIEEIRKDDADTGSSEKAVAADPPKKRRGRPPKPKPEVAAKPEPKAPAAVVSMPTPPPAPENKVIPPSLDDDDDDDVGGEQLFTPRLVPSSLPRVPGVVTAPIPTSPAQLRQQAAMQQQKVNEDFEATLSALEFEDGHHSVSVHRMEPEYDTNNGKRIAGYLEKFTRPVTFEEIRSKYGGGKYRFIIHGPGPFGKPTIKGNKIYEIAGDPIMPASHQRPGNQAPAPMIPEAVSEIVEKAISTHEKTADRLSEENRELSREMKQLLMATLNKGDGGLKETMMQMIAEERKLAETRALEERRLQEQRLAAEREQAKETRNLLLSMTNKPDPNANIQSILVEERRLQEQRLAAEREERRREQEAAERRHQQTLEMLRMQNEKQIEQMRIEQERVRAEAREASERARQQFELQLRQLEKQEAQKASDALKMTEFMASLQAQQVQQMQLAQQTQLQQMQQFTQLERDFMLKQIDTLGKKDNSIDQMLKLKQVMDVFTGSDKEPTDSKETWEKILDRINDSVPGIVAAAGLLRGTGQAQQAQAAEPRVLPGSVAVVEEEDVPEVRQNRRRRRRLPPSPMQAKRPVAPEPQAPQATPAEPTVEVLSNLPNDLTEFTFPTADTPVEQSLELLVKNIDLALQRELDVIEINEQVVKKFPPTVGALIANTDSDTLISILDVRAPATWRINSLDGQKKVRDLHLLLVSAR